uniref:Cytochrome P450 n=1 Tax=Rhizophora mucronata TaxID=61149 RepID=A0A2P2P0E7_RHIMU
MGNILLDALALIFLYCLWRSIVSRNRKSKKIQAPEPSGSWPLIGHLHLVGTQEPLCKALGAIADNCGPIFTLRLGIQQVLVVSSWETVKECFTTNDRTFASRASIAAGKYLGYNNAMFALAPYGQYWRDVRKLVTLQLLSNHRLEMLKHVRLSEVETLIKNLHNLCSRNDLLDKSPPSTKVSISKLLEGLAFNISLRLVVGKRFSGDKYGEKNSEAWRYKKAIREAVYLFGLFVPSDAVPWLEFMDPQGHISAMKRTAKELDAIIGTWLDEHAAARLAGESSNVGESDLMDVMMSSLADGELSGHPRDDIIKSTAFVLTLTGSESTAVTTTWALSLLLNNPKVLKAAQEELDIQVGRQKWVQESDIPKLKFLQAIVKETLRLYPPGPLTGIREATEDCYVGGYFVPKGTRLIANIWKLHRDARVWENPCEFLPERFLGAHADVDVKGQNFEYIPFGSGRRSCPAINLGLQVVHLTLARLLQGFDFETIAGCPVDMQEGFGLALPKLKPLEVLIKPRHGLELYQ